MAQASSMIVIFAPADAIWQVINDFGAAGDYLTGIVDCKVEGNGIGGRRMLTAADGSTIVEQLEMLDTADRQLNYSLLTDTPFVNCLTTMALHDLGSHQTELRWSAIFDADGIPEDEAVLLLESALAENCQALKRFIEIGRPAYFGPIT